MKSGSDSSMSQHSAEMIGVNPTANTESTSILYNLPAEVRDLVFQECFENEDGCQFGRGSALLQALKPDEMLYDEALIAFYESRQIVLNKENIRGFETTFPDEEILLIKNLKLEIDVENDSRSTAPEDINPDEKQIELHKFLDHLIRSSSPLWSQNKLALAANVRTLIIQFRVRSSGSRRDVRNLQKFDRVQVLVGRCLEYFKVEKLNVVLLMAGATGFTANFFDKIHVLLGMEGSLVRGYRRSEGVGMRDRYIRTDEWVWRAEKRNVLKKVGKGRPETWNGQW